MALAALGLVAAVLLESRRGVIACGVAAAFVVNPVLGVGVCLGLLAWAALGHRPRSSSSGDDEAALAELTALGLSAGLTFSAAANAAASSVSGDASTRLRRALRVGGESAANPVDDDGLMIVARRALSTGAPLQPAVSGYATTLRNEERSRQLNAARRLPVKLLFPLALLILPGFLILTIGPAVIGSLDRLGVGPP
jgi:tight adherence protein C